MKLLCYKIKSNVKVTIRFFFTIRKFSIFLTRQPVTNFHESELYEGSWENGNGNNKKKRISNFSILPSTSDFHAVKTSLIVCECVHVRRQLRVCYIWALPWNDIEYARERERNRAREIGSRVKWQHPGWNRFSVRCCLRSNQVVSLIGWCYWWTNYHHSYFVQMHLCERFWNFLLCELSTHYSFTGMSTKVITEMIQ